MTRASNRDRLAGGDWIGPLELYVAVPPCGVGIPARVGQTPGEQDCCIFALQQQTSGGPVILVPVLDPAGNPVRRPVFNIYDAPIPPLLPPGESYLRIERDKLGRWLTEPWKGAVDGTATTTPGATTSTTPGPGPGPCANQCKFTWNATLCWVQTINGCSTTSTTTTSTTTSTTPGGTTSSTSSTSSTTSTTPPPCLCPTTSTSAGPTTTSSTSSTTSTTPPPCQCTYPSFPGKNVGDCTYTYCAQGATANTYGCGPSTTTCNCNTTTTTTSTTSTTPNCGTGCTWTVNGFGGYSFSGGGCAPSCPCYPPGGSPAPCASYHTPCVPVVVTPPPPPPPCCSGQCFWQCFGAGASWYFVGSTCSGACGGTCLGAPGGCGCVVPSLACPSCGAVAVSGCDCPPLVTTTGGGTTTTTAAPACGNCYTTSTTTTTPPCGGPCWWKWALGNPSYWAQQSGSCQAACACSAPVWTGHDSCEIAITYCVSTTSTTTTSTTTTTTSTTTTSTSTTTTACPCNQCGCSWQCALSGGVWTWVNTSPGNSCSCGAAATCGAPCYCVSPSGLCGPAQSGYVTSTVCSGTTTTTSTTAAGTTTSTSTSTSTTTTPAPCGNCVWVWNGSAWGLGNGCSGGGFCNCNPPGFNGSFFGQTLSTACF